MAAARIVAPILASLAADSRGPAAALLVRTMAICWLMLPPLFPASIGPCAAQTPIPRGLAPNAVLQENQRAQERMERATEPPRLKGPALVVSDGNPPVRLTPAQSRRRHARHRE